MSAANIPCGQSETANHSGTETKRRAGWEQNRNISIDELYFDPPNEQAGEVGLAIRFVMIGASHNFD